MKKVTNASEKSNKKKTKYDQVHKCLLPLAAK
jgi:hypothetical protein